MINVTKAFLPPLSEYTEYLQKVWDAGQLTNGGQLLVELEEKLRTYFGTQYLHVVNNGTIALQIAIKALDLKGRVITTPFSYVATTSSLVWEGCLPQFVDIDPRTLNINPALIEAAITEDTTAILATHVYGNPCDVEMIESIADKFDLKVIYDSAHAFGVSYKGKPLPVYGDIATLSFHATKVFHTGEGGAIICRTKEISDKVAYLRNFGHNGPENFFGLGINGKNSELHAAMGLCVLPRVPEIIAMRRMITQEYDRLLQGLGDLIETPEMRPQTDCNYGYYPILFRAEEQLLAVVADLNRQQIFPRRYFYPSLNTLSYVPPSTVPVADSVSKRVLCLPLSHALRLEDVGRICTIIRASLIMARSTQQFRGLKDEQDALA